MTIRRRLTGAFALLLLSLLLVGAAGAAGVLVATRATEEVTSSLGPARQANEQVIQALLDAETGLRGYELAHDSSFLAPYDQGRRNYPGAVAAARAALRRDPTGTRLLDQQTAAGEKWLQEYATPTAAQSPLINTTRLARGKSLFDAFRARNTVLQEYLTSRRAALLARAEWVENITLLTILGLTLLATGAGVLIGRRTTRELQRPLDGARRVLAALTSGEHSARVPVSGPAEIRGVASSINALADERDRLAAVDAERERLIGLETRLSRQIRTSLDVESVLQQATLALGEALGVDRVYVRLADSATGALGAISEEWRSSAAQPVPPEEQYATPGSPTVLQGLYDRQESIVTDDVHASDFYATERGRHWLTVTGARSVVTAVIPDSGRGVGILTVMQTRCLRSWRPSEVRLIESAGQDLGRALVHARNFAAQTALVEQLRELDQRKNDFVSTVSHELRTPLTSISGYAELLGEGDAGPLSVQQQRMLEVIRRNTGRLQSLIEDLLTLSRIEAGALRGGRDDVDLAELVRRGVEDLHVRAAEAGVALSVRAPSSPVTTHGDPGQLERVVLNLTDNAVKFTPRGGSVQVFLDTVADTAVVRVVDTGIGIPAGQQHKLFSRFFRASNATARAVPGTGLGLTIVRAMVASHEGTLTLHSTEGVGTMVEVRLPLVAAETPAVLPLPA